MKLLEFAEVPNSYIMKWSTVSTGKGVKGIARGSLKSNTSIFLGVGTWATYYHQESNRKYIVCLFPHNNCLVPFFGQLFFVHVSSHEYLIVN